MSTLPARAQRPPAAQRSLLGGRRGLMSQVRVYRTSDAIQADEVEGYDVTRRSVLLDEVLLVTWHRSYGWAFLLGTAVMVTISAAASLMAAIASAETGLVVFAFTGLPFVVLAGLRLGLGIDTVTVYGRRTKVSMDFWFRKRRGRDVFSLVCRLARERQRRAQPRPRAGSGMPPVPRGAAAATAAVPAGSASPAASSADPVTPLSAEEPGAPLAR